MKRRVIALLMTVAMAASITMAGCAGDSKTENKKASDGAATEAKSEGAKADTASGEKVNIKFYGKVIEYTSGPKMTDALEEKLKDQYNIESIQVDWANQDKVIRTGIASGEPCDIYNFPPNEMSKFKDMAADLTPYLDADPEWKAQFEESALASGTIDGKILSIPWESNFTVVLANKKLLDDAGIEVPQSWNYEEFKQACGKIQESGVFPFANANDLGRSSWLYRNGILSETLSAGTYEDFTKGALPLNGPEVKKTLEDIQSLFDDGYMYPGEGAVTVKNDEIKAAFSQGKVAMMGEIAAGAKATAEEFQKSGIDVVIVPWPKVGEQDAINGGNNGFFIPKNCKDIDAAVAVLKAYTSTDIQAIHAADGYIPANKDVEITDDFVKSIVAQAAFLHSEDPASTLMSDYRSNNLIADLILNGGVDTVMENLEEIRMTTQQGEE